jgi:hypothetical protein
MDWRTEETLRGVAETCDRIADGADGNAKANHAKRGRNFLVDLRDKIGAAANSYAIDNLKSAVERGDSATAKVLIDGFVSTLEEWATLAQAGVDVADEDCDEEERDQGALEEIPSDLRAAAEDLYSVIEQVQRQNLMLCSVPSNLSPPSANLSLVAEAGQRTIQRHRRELSRPTTKRKRRSNRTRKA